MSELSECKRCELHDGDVHPVPGEGGVSASVMFVGRDPGANENVLGRPFVGAAGKFLREEIHRYFGNKSEHDVYITNVVKCHTLNNIGPSSSNIEACSYHLKREIIYINPKIIVALGKVVTVALLNKVCDTSDLPRYIDIHNCPMWRIVDNKYNININSHSYVVVPCYHPSPRNRSFYGVISGVIRDVKESLT